MRVPFIVQRATIMQRFVTKPLKLCRRLVVYCITIKQNTRDSVITAATLKAASHPIISLLDLVTSSLQIPTDTKRFALDPSFSTWAFETFRGAIEDTEEIREH